MAFSSVQTFLLLPSVLIIYAVLRILYNLFLHPLRSYPGPLFGRATLLASQKALYDGRIHDYLRELHSKYGTVVRYAPNELSFIEPDVWKDVYGHRATALVKDVEFYGPDYFGNPPGILRADNVAHARQRKLASHAFSDKALREQEVLLKDYAALLIRKLQEVAKGAGKTDMVKWFNFTTFDIMADLTFGEPLKLLEESEYTPWVRALFDNIKMVSLTQMLRRWPQLAVLIQYLIPAHIKEQRRLHMTYSSARIEQRLARKTDRPDIWTYVTRHMDTKDADKGLDPTEMHSTGALFMLAGTETTATLLSGLTYHLLKNPAKLEQLTNEVRSTFSTFDDITMPQLAQMPYLNACIEEGLRIYPPVAAQIPRTTPKQGAIVCGHWIPGGVTVTATPYAAFHSPANFAKPAHFLPERWLPASTAQGSEFAADRRDVFQPFSYGPRNCVGKNLAYHEMRLVLASVLLHFDMELCGESEGWLDQQAFILWKKGPLMVRLRCVRE